nr:PREDICTED: uncharacterized protein LOC108214035 isoform X2 [Daucus carota subsp. sativus]
MAADKRKTAVSSIPRYGTPFREHCRLIFQTSVNFFDYSNPNLKLLIMKPRFDLSLGLLSLLMAHSVSKVFLFRTTQKNISKKIRRNMVSFKFISLCFMLLLVLRYSYADSQIPQAAGNDGIAGAVAGNRNPWAVEKFIIGGVLTPKEAKNGNILGRNMMKRRVLMEEMQNTREMSTTILAGAAHSVGNSCSREGKQKFSSDCRRSSRTSRDRHAARKLKYTSFVALNADYHPPKSHAPKNN